MKDLTRINRTTYLLGEGILGLLVLPLAYVADTDPGRLESSALLSFSALAFLVLAFYYSFRFAIARLHDIGLSGWFAVLRLVPGAQLVLMIWPGESKENKYGPQPGKHFDFNALF